ncbi:5905_t:CDS:2 [Gigaspora margarita]|uniref:5905_t:CDS:1 n=1 Tax=Gigaspora margarita TaxID=4874 RepID=A0ABN7V7B8_GIGMA|nr:5905_t:CDS:2 [Gigaspora margarita]
MNCLMIYDIKEIDEGQIRRFHRYHTNNTSDIEQALEISKNKAEEKDDAQNQIAEDTDEDIISSDQYKKRLKQQFEKLYPIPN